LAQFNKAAPSILADLYDSVATGIRNYPTVELEITPRMADFAKWATACEPSHSEPGKFLKAYAENRENTSAVVIDSDEVATGVRDLMDTFPEWKGTATELLTALSEQVSDTERRARSFPKNAKLLSERISRAAPVLRKIGIQIDSYREGKDRHRIICISKPQSIEISTSAAVSASAINGKFNA
jgi:hypothetical protein